MAVVFTAHFASKSGSSRFNPGTGHARAADKCSGGWRLRNCDLRARQKVRLAPGLRAVCNVCHRSRDSPGPQYNPLRRSIRIRLSGCRRRRKATQPLRHTFVQRPLRISVFPGQVCIYFCASSDSRPRRNRRPLAPQPWSGDAGFFPSIGLFVFLCQVLTVGRRILRGTALSRSGVGIPLPGIRSRARGT